MREFSPIQFAAIREIRVKPFYMKTFTETERREMEQAIQSVSGDKPFQHPLPEFFIQPGDDHDIVRAPVIGGGTQCPLEHRELHVIVLNRQGMPLAPTAEKPSLLCLAKFWLN